MRINPEILIPNVIGELQEAKYKSEVSKEISREDYVQYLIRGFYALYLESGNRGIAFNLKPEFETYKEYLPGWMKYYWKFEKDYDLTEYDTGDPIEIALKILTGWIISEPYFKTGRKPGYGERIFRKDDFQKIFDISVVIIRDSLEDNGDDIGVLKKAAEWVAILSWTGYNFDEVEEIKRFIKTRVPKGRDAWFDVVVYGDATHLMDVMKDYTSWLLFRDAIIGLPRR